MTKTIQRILLIFLFSFTLLGCSKIVGQYEIKLKKGTSTIILYEDLTFKQIGSIWEGDSEKEYNGNWKYLDKNKKIIETTIYSSGWDIWTLNPTIKYKVEKDSLVILKDDSSSVAKENTEVSRTLSTLEINRKNRECSIPEKIRSLAKNLKDWSFIEETDLSIYFSDENNVYPKRDCYSFIENDFTNDDESDFICIMKNVEKGYSLVAFNNYETKLEFIEIKKATDYGEYGIGDILYYDSISEGFFSIKLESSAAHIVWENNAYEIKYND